MQAEDPFHNLSAIATQHQDERGWLRILYESKGIVLKTSESSPGVLRGLHWQKPPATQEKIIRVVSGEIIDFVAKPNDPDQKIFARRIYPDSGWVYINGEWAHGFYTHTGAVFEYLCIGSYNEDLETSLNIERVLKSELEINAVRLSVKDKSAPAFGRRVIWTEDR